MARNRGTGNRYNPNEPNWQDVHSRPGGIVGKALGGALMIPGLIYPLLRGVNRRRNIFTRRR